MGGAFFSNPPPIGVFAAGGDEPAVRGILPFGAGIRECAATTQDIPHRTGGIAGSGGGSGRFVLS